MMATKIYFGPPVPDERREFLFKENISLFIENSELILNDERFRNAVITHGFCAFMWASIANETITLGEVLHLWLEHSEFSLSCKCGKKQYLVHFGGSPLSGLCFTDYFCPYCKTSTGLKGKHRLRILAEIRRQYKPDYKTSSSLEPLEDLVILLNDKILEERFGEGHRYFYEIIRGKDAPDAKHCIEAIRYKHGIFLYIKPEFQTVEIAMEAIKHNVDYFKYICCKCRTYKVWLTAILKKPTVLRYLGKGEQI